MRKNMWIHIFMAISLLACDRSMQTTAADDSSTHKSVQDSYQILFVGNSLTYSNNMPDMVAALARHDSIELTVLEYCIPGTPLRAMVSDQDLEAKIQIQEWDAVLLQSDDITAFPDMYEIELNTLKHFDELIHAESKSTRMIYEMIWGAQKPLKIRELDGSWVVYSPEDYIRKIRTGTVCLTQSMGCGMAPAGWAWHEAIQKDEAWRDKLFARDGFHPAPAGSYLTACVIYMTLTGRSVLGNTYQGGLSGQEAQALQAFAHHTITERSWE